MKLDTLFALGLTALAVGYSSFNQKTPEIGTTNNLVASPSIDNPYHAYGSPAMDEIRNLCRDELFTLSPGVVVTGDWFVVDAQVIGNTTAMSLSTEGFLAGYDRDVVVFCNLESNEYGRQVLLLVSSNGEF